MTTSRTWTTPLGRAGAATAERAGIGTLILTHHVPAPAPGTEDEWRKLAEAEFSGRIEIGDDLHRVDVE